MADKKKDTYVYIKDPEFAWVPAKLDRTEGDKAYVGVFHYKDQQSIISDSGRTAKKVEDKVINLKDYQHKVLPLQNLDGNGSLIECSDMVTLPYLHEAGILYNLKKRHGLGKPYTRTGDIIIAVNPFQWFTDLYTEDKRSYYSNRLVWDKSEKDQREGMEPHVYEVSALAYKGLAFGGGDQSILVSGESGAGKTETVKIAMNHMASVQKGPAKKGDSNELDPVVKRVVESNPLLEAFGNAKTRRNDNSSRFGKYLQLQFDNFEAGVMQFGDLTESKCKLAGSKCDVYLLEKNRVVGHDTEERTYHIFYQILSAPESQKGDIWSQLKGKKFTDFKYVGHTDTLTIEKETDAQHWDHTVNTLKLIHVVGDKFKNLMRGICAVMQCGNLTFGPLKGDKDKSEITSPKETKALAELLGVSESDLSLSFTERTMKTKTESYKVPLNAVNAKDACDALGKEIYGNIFLWLVQQINIATKAEDNYKGGGMSGFGLIGLLDIFGFESFTVNRFEQLCINYANEKLQQKFTEDIFRSVQDEYESEGIALAEIWYDDNTDVLDLIEGRTGLLALLNEECVRPKGNDQEFVQKALAQNKKSPCLIVNKLDRMSFGVHHYAGKVMYDADQFVARNTDTIPTDLSDLCLKSSNPLISTPPVQEDAPVKTKRQKSNLVAPTVWGKYKTQLASLMGNLRKTSSRYIRCVKPNMAKKPILMDHLPTVEQLRCAGVVAAVTLSRSAFPNRLDNSVVRYRYKNMWDQSAFKSKRTGQMTPEQGLSADCEAMMTCALKPKELVDGNKVIKAFVVGRTRTYFRAGALEYLEANRLESGLDGPATNIQKVVRGFLIRRKMGDLIRAHADGERKKREEEERKKREAQKKKEEEEKRKKAEAERKRREELKKKQEAERLEKERKRKAEEERIRREEEERKAAEERAIKEAEDKLKKQVAKLEKELSEKKKSNKERIKEAEAEAEEVEKEMDILRKQHDEMLAKAAETPKEEISANQKKIQDSEKITAYLKKENKKVRDQTEKFKNDLEELKKENNKLVEQNASAGAALDSLERESKQLAQHNVKLDDNLKKWKDQNKQLKSDLQNRVAYYNAETKIRAEYTEAMRKIVEMIEERCPDKDLVAQVLEAKDECEKVAAYKDSQ